MKNVKERAGSTPKEDRAIRTLADDERLVKAGLDGRRPRCPDCDATIAWHHTVKEDGSIQGCGKRLTEKRP
jgi:hypothetical protein